MRNTFSLNSRQFGIAAMMSAVLTTASTVNAAITIPTLTIANAANAPDTRVMNDGTTGYGRVNYNYSIGKYEVTAGQYTAFLNAVASTDTYSLYNTSMTSDAAGCQIVRSGSAGAYTYTVASDYTNRPVNYVSWGDAARFSNWLANGQPTGAQSSSTTESGSYSLSGAVSSVSLLNVSRDSSATWVISSENEWYKAAFYNPLTATYSLYATGSNTLPSNDLNASDAGNNANYMASQTDSTLGSPYYRSEVGAFTNSVSAYGAFDQNGNVQEWTEASYLNAFREIRGGSFGSYDVSLASSFRYFDDPTYEDNTLGFRVASTVVVAIAGDFNGDQSVNSFDIDLLFAAAQGTVAPASVVFDLTGDGKVNSTPDTAASDADYLIRVVLGTEYGDATLDGKVNFDDLVVLAQNYNAATGTWAHGNFDGKGGVNFDDLILLAQHYNFGMLATLDSGAFSEQFLSDWQLSFALAPEPGTLSVMLAAVAICRRRLR